MVAVMTEAQYWFALCGNRDLVDNPWCRRLLAEAADKTLTTGFCGRAWVFQDESILIANLGKVVVR